MNTGEQGARPLALGILGVLLAVTCCGGPILIAVLANAGVSAWLASSGYLLIAIAVVAIGLIGVGLYRRNRSAAADCCARDQNV